MALPWPSDLAQATLDALYSHDPHQNLCHGNPSG